MQAAILIDFDSTYTKVIGVDLDDARLLGTAQAPSTVDSDVAVGLQLALALLAAKGVPTRNPALMLASSSAAGGLRMVAVGMVPCLTVRRHGGQRSAREPRSFRSSVTG